MEVCPNAASGQRFPPLGVMVMDGTVQRPTGDAAKVPVSRVVVVLRRSSGDRGEDRVEAPDRVLRLWAMLNAANEDLHRAAVPPESVRHLQQVLEGVNAELERSVSPSLADEWHRLVPHREAAGLAQLRIEYVSLLGWVGGLVIEILTQLEAAGARQPRGGLPAAAGSACQREHASALPDE